MSRILVTGASGLLGANLALAACGEHDVVAIYHHHALTSSRFRAQSADLSLESKTSELLSSTRPDWIVHCAAVTNVDECQAHPAMAWRYNAEMPRFLAEAARRVGSRMVYISTDSVFDGQGSNYAEEDKPSPVNVYARSKLAGEHAVRKALESAMIVRTNLYGWNVQEKLSLAEWIVKKLEGGESIDGFQDVHFTPILANDLASIILLMMGMELGGLYHVAGSQRFSKYEFACDLARVFGLDPKLVRPASITESTLIAPRPLDTSLCVSKASRSLGIGMPNIISGLQGFKALHEAGYPAKLKSLNM